MGVVGGRRVAVGGCVALRAAACGRREREFVAPIRGALARASTALTRLCIRLIAKEGRKVGVRDTNTTCRRRYRLRAYDSYETYS